MLSRHCVAVAAIFLSYFGLMTALGWYMWRQVRHHEDRGEDDPERALA